LIAEPVKFEESISQDPAGHNRWHSRNSLTDRNDSENNYVFWVPDKGKADPCQYIKEYADGVEYRESLVKLFWVFSFCYQLQSARDAIVLKCKNPMSH
jgi:hypothetical protein